MDCEALTPRGICPAVEDRNPVLIADLWARVAEKDLEIDQLREVMEMKALLLAEKEREAEKLWQVLERKDRELTEAITECSSLRSRNAQLEQQLQDPAAQKAHLKEVVEQLQETCTLLRETVSPKDHHPVGLQLDCGWITTTTNVVNAIRVPLLTYEMDTPELARLSELTAVAQDLRTQVDSFRSQHEALERSAKEMAAEVRVSKRKEATASERLQAVEEMMVDSLKVIEDRTTSEILTGCFSTISRAIVHWMTKNEGNQDPYHFDGFFKKMMLQGKIALGVTTAEDQLRELKEKAAEPKDMPALDVSAMKDLQAVVMHMVETLSASVVEVEELATEGNFDHSVYSQVVDQLRILITYFPTHGMSAPELGSFRACVTDTVAPLLSGLTTGVKNLKFNILELQETQEQIQAQLTHSQHVARDNESLLRQEMYNAGALSEEVEDLRAIVTQLNEQNHALHSELLAKETQEKDVAEELARMSQQLQDLETSYAEARHTLVEQQHHISAAADGERFYRAIAANMRRQTSQLVHAVAGAVVAVEKLLTDDSGKAAATDYHEMYEGKLDSVLNEAFVRPADLTQAQNQSTAIAESVEATFANVVEGAAQMKQEKTAAGDKLLRELTAEHNCMTYSSDTAPVYGDNVKLVEEGKHDLEEPEADSDGEQAPVQPVDAKILQQSQMDKIHSVKNIATEDHQLSGTETASLEINVALLAETRFTDSEAASVLLGISSQPSLSPQEDDNEALREEYSSCEQGDTGCSKVSELASILLDLASDNSAPSSTREPESAFVNAQVNVDNQADVGNEDPVPLLSLQASSIAPEHVGAEIASQKRSAASLALAAGAEAENNDTIAGSVLAHRLPEVTVAPPVQKEDLVGSERSQTVSPCQGRSVEGPATGVELESDDLATEMNDKIQPEESILQSPQTRIVRTQNADVCNIEAYHPVDGVPGSPTRSPKRLEYNDDSRAPESNELQNIEATKKNSNVDERSPIDSLSGQQQNHAVPMNNTQRSTGWSTYVATGFTGVALVAAVVGLKTVFSRK